MHGLANSSWISRASAASLLAATTPVGRPCITCGRTQHTQSKQGELVSAQCVCPRKEVRAKNLGN